MLILFSLLFLSFDLSELLFCLCLCVGSDTVSMSLRIVDLSTACHRDYQITVFLILCHVADVNLNWKQLVKFPLLIELIKQESLGSFMDHAMTSNKENSKVHLFWILFEYFCHLCHHLQCLLLRNTLIWIFDVFI